MAEEIKNTQLFNAIGRRKEAKVKVILEPGGSGVIMVNGMDYKTYFPLLTLQNAVNASLALTGLQSSFDVKIMAQGGGKHGQAEAVRLGIARALLKYNPELRKTLRAAGFLTRDSRVKERKKYGLKRARKAPQWQKR